MKLNKSQGYKKESVKYVIGNYAHKYSSWVNICTRIAFLFSLFYVLGVFEKCSDFKSVTAMRRILVIQSALSQPITLQ